MELIKFDAAKRALAEAKTVDEVRGIRDKAEAFRVYCKQAGESLEMQNWCAEIKIRAERRAGELLKELPKQHGGRPPDTGLQSVTPSLKDLGIEKIQSHRWQKLAAIPKKDFNKHIESVKEKKTELTTAGLLRECKRDRAPDPIQELPSDKYRIIYADPPWKYGNAMPDYFTEQADHYKLLTPREVSEIPVKDICEDNSVLFLWVTSPILEEAFNVIHAWGFKYKASFVWDKIKHNMGHYNSVRHEFLLVCTRGSCQPDQQKLFDSVQSIEREKHSQKPEEFRDIIETLYTHGRKIELFARTKNKGWDVYGNDPSIS